MSYEWLLISLPIIFVLGWVSARLDIRHIRKTAGELPRAYLRGLSYLLVKDEDKALDTFLEAPPVATESFEFQFAIGELSRRRGDYKRALYVHRQLYGREDLPIDVRHRALWQLVTDYFNMGFVDYAEQHALPLIDDSDYGESAFILLLTIYQRRHLYERALKMVEALGEEAMLLRRKTVAHLYCQCAVVSLDQSPEQYQPLLEKALAVNADCVRAILMLADMILAEAPDRAKEAQRHYALVESKNPDYLWCAVPGFLQSTTQMGCRDAGFRQIIRWLTDHPSPMLFRVVYDALSTADEANYQAVRRQVTEQFLLTYGGSIASAYWVEQQATDQHTEAWMALKKTLQNMTGKAFACNHCGYEVNHFSWQCRGCLEWESLIQRR